MKKILFIISIVSLFITSCQPTEVKDVFNETAEQRAQAAIDEMKAELVSSPDGWLATYTFLGGKESMVMKLVFNDKDRAAIDVMSDSYIVDQNPELKHMESSYTINYTQQLDLVFDTYGTFSKLLDEGMGTDFRWELESKDDNSFTFNSRDDRGLRNTTLHIEKLTTERLEEELQKQKTIGHLRNDPSKSLFRTLDVTEPVVTRFDYSFRDGEVTFEDDKGNLSLQTVVDLSIDGFKLVKPLIVGGKEISNFILDDDGNFHIVNDGVKAKLVYGATPAFAKDLERYDDYIDLVFFKGMMCYDLSSKDFQKVFDDVETALHSDPELSALNIQVSRFDILSNRITFSSGPYNDPNIMIPIATFNVKVVKEDGLVKIVRVDGPEIGTDGSIKFPIEIQKKVVDKIQPLVDMIMKNHVFLFQTNFMYDIFNFVSGDPATTHFAVFGLTN